MERIGRSLLHALLFLPLILLGKNRKYRDVVAENRLLPSIKELGQMLLTFFLVVIGWIIFRAESIGQAWDIIGRFLNPDVFTLPFIFVGTKKSLVFVLLMVLVEWCFRKKEHCLQFKSTLPAWIPTTISFILIILILEFAAHSQSFIYFQF